MLNLQTAVRRAAVFLDRWHWALLALAAPFLLFPSPSRSLALFVVPGLWLVAWLAGREPLLRAPLFAPSGPLRTPWLEALASPSIWSGRLSPFAESLCIFLVRAPVTLLVLGALGNHGPLLYPSRTRIVVGSFLAPLAGLRLAMLALWLGGGLPRRLAELDFLADYRNLESAKYAAGQRMTDAFM